MTAALLLACVACSASRQREPDAREPAPATVRVENRSPSQLTVYVLRAGQRIRLGMARGSSTTVLVVPESVMAGATSVGFRIDPLGGPARSTSYEIPMSPGDQATIIYP